MAEQNYLLYVASYGDDSAAAKDDFKVLNSTEDVVVVVAVVLDRDSAGKVEVREHGGGLVGGGALAGAAGGIVIGLFAPPLFAVTVLGAAIGAGVGEILKRHREKQIGVNAEEWLPAGSSAIVAVIDDTQLDAVDAAVTKAVKRTSKAIDKGDYDAVIKAMSRGGDEIVKAVG